MDMDTPRDGTSEDGPLAGIDPELIKELDNKTKEIVAEAFADGTLGALLEADQIFPPPGDPMQVARKLLKNWTHNGLTTLLHWRGSWMEWQFTHWVEIEEATIRARAYARLEKAVFLLAPKPKKTQEPGEKTLASLAAPWLPNRRKVGDVMEAMKGCVHLPESVDTPSWLPGAPMRNGAYLWPAELTVSCTNGLLDVTTRQLTDLTPGFFNRVSVPFNYDPNATEPTRWLEFLSQLWPDDPDSIAALQEWFGYVLSGRTDLEKILLMIGPARSGKGTIARILAAMVGRGNVAGPTLASLQTNFGLSPMLGKPLAIVSDARLGGNTNVPAVVERLLAISGEDMLTIDRKYREPWSGKLPTRFMIISNELPRFGDASGAIASRFIVVSLLTSWLGKENPRLTNELSAELPGILLWALSGLDRLAANDTFTQPAASLEAILALQDLISPISAFVRDSCTVGLGHEVSAKDLFDAWKDWCESNGHRPGSAQSFGRDLRAVIPHLKVRRPRTGDSRERWYQGVALKPSTDHNGADRGPHPRQSQNLARSAVVRDPPHCGPNQTGSPLRASQVQPAIRLGR